MTIKPMPGWAKNAMTKASNIVVGDLGSRIGKILMQRRKKIPSYRYYHFYPMINVFKKKKNKKDSERFLIFKNY